MGPHLVGQGPPHHPHYKRYMANVEVILQSDQSFMTLVGRVEANELTCQEAGELVVCEFRRKTEGNPDGVVRGAVARFKAWGSEPCPKAIAHMIGSMVEERTQWNTRFQ